VVPSVFALLVIDAGLELVVEGVFWLVVVAVTAAEEFEEDEVCE